MSACRSFLHILRSLLHIYSQSVYSPYIFTVNQNIAVFRTGRIDINERREVCLSVVLSYTFTANQCYNRAVFKIRRIYINKRRGVCLSVVRSYIFTVNQFTVNTYLQSIKTQRFSEQGESTLMKEEKFVCLSFFLIHLHPINAITQQFSK